MIDRLEPQIAALHAQIEQLIERAVDAMRVDAGGVPRDVIRQMLEAKAWGFCLCKCARNLEGDYVVSPPKQQEFSLDSSITDNLTPRQAVQKLKVQRHAR
jgi:hypothetical protein